MNQIQKLPCMDLGLSACMIFSPLVSNMLPQGHLGHHRALHSRRQISSTRATKGVRPKGMQAHRGSPQVPLRGRQRRMDSLARTTAKGCHNHRLICIKAAMGSSKGALLPRLGKHI